MPEMISELELTGEFGPEHTAEAVGGFDRKPASGRRGGHGLLWGSAGALAASAVWATAVFAYGIGGDRKPDTHGYQVGGRSCSVMQMTALTASVGKRAEAPSLLPGTIETPALDSVSCTMSLASPDAPAENDHGWSYRLHVGMSVELHKETDPCPNSTPARIRRSGETMRSGRSWCPASGTGPTCWSWTSRPRS
ncbi:hypothetical protein Smic_28280 [Streptomyces microflavus]|uniref:Uncharacterized protein n=1 Tax=Streptomyces microflavus TaxID=1919 RepID=A0A7J0CP49_STRMI|nr:hypothetical protein Smic_28280 [Streptomyces microflavus]